MLWRTCTSPLRCLQSVVRREQNTSASEAHQQLIKSREKGLGFVVVEGGLEQQLQGLLNLMNMYQRHNAKCLPATAQTKAHQL